MRIVFTGPVTDEKGNRVSRKILTQAVQCLGYIVENKVGPQTTCLVASRHDTTKAKAAEWFGTLVVDYVSFISMVKSQAAAGRVLSTTGESVRTSLPLEQSPVSVA